MLIVEIDSKDLSHYLISVMINTTLTPISEPLSDDLSCGALMAAVCQSYYCGLWLLRKVDSLTFTTQTVAPEE